MKFLGDFILKRKRAKLIREVYFKKLSDVKSVLIIYDCTNPETEEKVRSFARYFIEERLEVESIGYYSKVGKNISKPIDELGYSYFDKKDLNSYKFPKSLKIKKTISNQYDLMIDLNMKEHFSLEVLSSLSRSRFKVGSNNKYGNEIFDLTIDIKENNLDYLIEQIKIYLGMINK
jgi:hypothetical protein